MYENAIKINSKHPETCFLSDNIFLTVKREQNTCYCKLPQAIYVSPSKWPKVTFHTLRKICEPFFKIRFAICEITTLKEFVFVRK